MISIIVPVYNAEHKIDNLIKSLLSQSSKDFEVIFIDDKSNDDTVNYINQTLFNKKINYKILSNDINMGPGLSRNRGIKESKGSYILFVDADDFIETNTISDFENIINEKSIEILFFDYIRKNKKSSIRFKTIKNVNDGLNIKNLIFNANLSAMCKLYSKDFLIKNNLLFPPYYRGEDIIFSINAILKANNYYYLENSYYIYDIQNDSITMTMPGKIKIEELLDKYSYIDKNDLSNDLENYLYIRLVIIPFVYNMIIHKEKNDVIKNHIKNLKENIDQNFNINDLNISREDRFVYNSILKMKLTRYKLYRKLKNILKMIF